MTSEDIKNYINSSSLGVYMKYIILINNEKYLVKSGRGENEGDSSILEPVTECICYELAKLMGIPSAEYYLEEKDAESVSKEMNLKASVVYNRLSRGRKKLKDKIQTIL